MYGLATEAEKRVKEWVKGEFRRIKKSSNPKTKGSVCSRNEKPIKAQKSELKSNLLLRQIPTMCCS